MPSPGVTWQSVVSTEHSFGGNLTADGIWHSRFVHEHNCPKIHHHMLAVVNAAFRKAKPKKSVSSGKKWFLYVIIVDISSSKQLP